MSQTPSSNAGVWLLLIALLYLLLASVAGIGTGFKLLAGGEDGVANLFAFVSNAFSALMVGILGTALLQSSSTTTSIIVGLVAGGLPLDAAVPMIMGANIGTTITNTIVSLGQINHKKSFARALEAATVHDFFNFLAVLIFLPLELTTHLLSRLAQQAAGLFTGSTLSQPTALGLFKDGVKAPSDLLKSELLGLGVGEFWVGLFLTLVGVALIVVAITSLSRLLKRVMSGPARELMHTLVGSGSLKGIFVGAVTTVLVQSSSTTTSLMVPLASSKTLSLRDIYPFMLGANIGTTVTALLAAIAITGPLAGLALQIALVHLFFNLAAVSLIYGVPPLRKIPPRLAQRFAAVAVKKKPIAILYVVLAFLGIPALMVFIFH